MSLGGLAGLTAGFHHVFAQRRGNAGEVEPVGALKDLVPVEVGGLGLGNGGVGAVIDADAAALGSALFVKVDADPVAAPDNLGGVYAIAAQGVDSGLTDGVGGQLGDEGGIHTVIGQRDRHIGFAAAEGEFHMIALDKTLVVVGLQAEHQLAESNNLCHYFLASFTISTDFLHRSVISSHLPSEISLSGHI